MPDEDDILLPTGEKLPLDKVKRAEFWEEGANYRGHFVREEPEEPPIKAEEDTLHITMKNSETKDIELDGLHARRIFEELVKRWKDGKFSYHSKE